MRYAVMNNGTVSIESTPESAPGPGEALVRVSIALVTPADASGGPAASTPGRGVVGRREPDGARVVVGADLACGECERCRAGLGAHCHSRATLGDPGQPGATAEALVVPERQLVEIPSHVGDESAVFAHAASVALQAAGRLHIREQPYATVIGSGVEAILAAEALALASATVRVLSSSERTLTACEQRGVRSRPIQDAGRRGDQDVVVVCPGEEGALEIALAMARARGRVVLTPGADSSHATLRAASDQELDVLGSRWAPVAEGLGAIASGRLDPTGLMTRRVKLDRVGEAIGSLAARRELAVGVECA